MTVGSRPLLALLALALPALAGPAGRWRTVDDRTGVTKGVVELREVDGELRGVVVASFRKDRPNPTCDACDGERKGQPVIGMTFLWGLKRDGEGWSGGHILDPENGKVYRAKLREMDGGRRLEVRGYLGISLLGRTQVWQREP